MSADASKQEKSVQEQRLNSAAFLSLMGLDREWQANLTALLRSDAEIDRSVRELLADAIDGRAYSGVRFSLSGHELSSRWWASIKDRRRWYEFGIEVSPFIETAQNLPAAMEEASEKLGKSESYCKKAYYYRRDCEAWVRSAKEDGGVYATMSEQELASEFHLSSVRQGTPKPIPPSGQSFEAARVERIRALRRLIAPLNLEPGRTEALLEILYHLWEMPADQS